MFACKALKIARGSFEWFGMARDSHVSEADVVAT